MMNNMIEFRNVSKSYGENILFQGLSLGIGRGESLGLLGESGIGKTTLLKMAAGLIKPTEGSVEIISDKIGFVFQEPRLLPWKTALENVILACRNENRAERKVSIEKSRSYLKKLGLEEAEDRYPAELSGGMKQRVSIARALVTDPDVLLLDEPLSGVNESLRELILGIFRELRQERKTSIIYATHYPEELEGTVDRRLLFSESGIEASGT